MRSISKNIQELLTNNQLFSKLGFYGMWKINFQKENKQTNKTKNPNRSRVTAICSLRCVFPFGPSCTCLCGE